MGARSVLAALVAAASLAPASDPPAHAPPLTWRKPTGEIAWARALDPAEPTPNGAGLLAPEWYRPLPDLRIQLFEGEPVELRALRGKVVVLEFWASWCRPCARLLPALDALWRQEASRGLVALAINSDEPAEIVTRYVQARGITLPIGRYDSELDRSLAVRALPTVIVADRWGRIRGRWTGTVAEEDLTRVCRELLGEPEAPRISVARVTHGAGLLEADWTRQAPGIIQGMTFLPASQERAKLVVTTSQELIAFDGDGAGTEIGAGHPAAGLLRQADLDGDGRPELIGFQRGGERLVSFDSSPAPRAWTAPSPVLDVELLPGTRSGQAGVVLLATIGGLLRTPAAEASFQKVEGFGEVSDVAIVGSEAGPRIVVLEPGRRLAWLDTSWSTLGEMSPGQESFSLVAHPALDAVGLAPPEVVAAATGKFFAGPAYQAALATRSEQLWLVDLGTGEVLFRADWDGIERIAAGDLDSDGKDELAVAAGRRLTLLRGQAH